MSTTNQSSNAQHPASNTSSFFDFSPLSLQSSSPGKDESLEPVHSGGQPPNSQSGQPVLASNNPYFQHAKTGSTPLGPSPAFSSGPTSPPTSGAENQNIFQDMFSPLHSDSTTVSGTSYGQGRGRNSPTKRTSAFFPKSQDPPGEARSSAQDSQPTLVDISLPTPGASTQSLNQNFPPLTASPVQRTLSNDNSASLSASGNSWGRDNSSFTSNSSNDLAALGSSGIGDSVDDHQSPQTTFVALPSGAAPGERKPGLGRSESGKAGVIARPTTMAEPAKANAESQTNNQPNSAADSLIGQSWNPPSSSQSQRTDPDSSSDGRKVQTPLSTASSAHTTTGSHNLFGPPTNNQAPKTKPTPPVQNQSPALTNPLSSHGSSPNPTGSSRPPQPGPSAQAPPKQEPKLDSRLEAPSPAPAPYLPHGVPPPAPSAPPPPDNHEYPIPYFGSAREARMGGIAGMRSWGGPISAVPGRFADNRRPIGGELSGRDNTGISPPVGTIGSHPSHASSRGPLGVSLGRTGDFGLPGKTNDTLSNTKSGQSGVLQPIGSGASRLSSTSYELPRPPSILYPDPIPFEYRPSGAQPKRLASIDESIPEDRVTGDNTGISPTTSNTSGRGGPGVGGGLGLSFPPGPGGDASKGGQYSPRHRNVPRLSQTQGLGPNIGTRESVMRGQWVGGTMAMPTSTNASNSPGNIELGQSQPPQPTGRERSESSGYPVYMPQQGLGNSGRELKETYRLSQQVQQLNPQSRTELSTMQMQLQQAEEQQQRVRQRQMQMQQQQQQQQQGPPAYTARRPGLTTRPFSFEDIKPDDGQHTREMAQRQNYNYNAQGVRDDHGSPAGSAGSRRRVSNASGSGQRASLDLKTPDLPANSARAKPNEEDAIASLADLYPTLPTSHVQSLHSFALYLQEDALTAERGEKLKAQGSTGGAKRGFDESRLSALGISRMKRWDEWKELEEVERKRVIALISPGIAVSSSTAKRRSLGGLSENSSSGNSMEEAKNQMGQGMGAKGGQSAGKTNDSSGRTTPSTTPNVSKNPFTPTDYDEGETMQPLPPPPRLPDLADMDPSSQQGAAGDYRRGEIIDDDDDDDDDDSETREFYPSRRQRQAAAEAAAKGPVVKNESSGPGRSSPGPSGPPSPTPTDLQVAAAPKVDLELQMPRPLPSVPATRIDPSARRRLIDEESVAGTESRASTRADSAQDEGGAAAYYHPDQQTRVKKVDVDTRQLTGVVGSFSRRNTSATVPGSNNRAVAPSQPVADVPPLLRSAYAALEIATNNPSLENFLAEARRVLDGKTSILINAFNNESHARRHGNQKQAAALLNTGRFSYTDIERLGDEFEKEEARRRLELDKEVYLLFENTFVEVSYKEVKAQLEVLGRKWYEDVKNWLFNGVASAVGSPQQPGSATAKEYHLILESIDLLNKLHLAMEEHEHVLQNLVSERNSRYLQISVSPLLAVGDTARVQDAERRFWADEQERQLIAKMEAVKRAKDHANIVERADSELIRGLKRKFEELVQEVNSVITQFPSNVLPELFRRFFDYDLKGKVVINHMEEGFIVPPNAIAALGDSVQALSEIVSLVKLALDYQNDPQVKLCEATCSLQVTEDHARTQGITSPAITAAACSSALATLMPSALKRLTEEQAQRASLAQDDLFEVLRNLRSMVADFEKNPHLPAVTVRPIDPSVRGEASGDYQQQQPQPQQPQQPQQQQQQQLQQRKQSWPLQAAYGNPGDSPQQYSAGGYESPTEVRWGQVKQAHVRENMPNLASVIGSFKATQGSANSSNMNSPSTYSGGYQHGANAWGANPQY